MQIFETLNMQNLKNNTSVIKKSMYGMYSIIIQLNYKPKISLILLENTKWFIKYIYTLQVKASLVFLPAPQSFENYGVQTWGVHINNLLWRCWRPKTLESI